MVRVAINGFGRIGRLIFQAGHNDKSIEWVAVNDLTDPATLAHLLKYDSAYGKFDADISYGDDYISINKKKIIVLKETDPAKLPWKKLNIDIVAECTGRFVERDASQKHLDAGAKRVLISAPGKKADFTIVMGVNEHELKPEHKIVSNASCTTNCVAQLIKVMHDKYGIERGYMTTVHAYTADQRLVDAPHKDLRRARAAAVSIIPTSTGAARAVTEAIPELKGKIDGTALRVPILVGSIAILNAQIKKETTIEDVNSSFSKAASQKKGIIEYSEEPLVSHDIVKNPHSCVFDAQSTAVTGGNFITVSGWYDNEWGFSNRMVDVIKLMAK